MFPVTLRCGAVINDSYDFSIHFKGAEVDYWSYAYNGEKPPNDATSYIKYLRELSYIVEEERKNLQVKNIVEHWTNNKILQILSNTIFSKQVGWVAGVLLWALIIWMVTR